MSKKLLAFLGGAIMGGALFAVVPAFASLAPSPSPCATTGTPFITITRHLTNNPDSGTAGNWATDAYTEHVTVWVGTDGTSYCANANTTDGTFTTTGPLSPGAGAALAAGITGTFTGGENYTFASTSGLTLNPAYSTTSPKSVTLADDNSVSSGGKFSWWVNEVFPSVASTSGSSYVDTYALTYVVDGLPSDTWTNADASSGGNSGDILSSVVYVDPSGSDTNDGSAAHPFKTIQAAVNAVATGGTVNVAAGTYAETVSVGKALTLNGAQHGTAAYSGSGTARTGSESQVSEIDVTASNVKIDGFTFTNSAGSQVNVTGSSVLSGVAVKNNIFSGYSNVGLVTLEAGNIAISGNLFTNPVTNSEAIQVKDFSTGNQGCTGTSISSNAFVAATDNGGADVNLSCTGSNSTNVTVSNNYDADNQGGSSFAAFSGVDSGITVSGNQVLRTSGSSIYFFGAVTGSVSITGNSITGATTSSAVSVQGIDGASTGTFTITGNTLSGNGRGLKIGGDAGADISGAASITFTNNDISGSTIEAVKNNSTSGISIGATQNYWGHDPVVGTDIAGAGNGNVVYSPWYTDSGKTTLKSTTTTSGGEASTTVPTEVTESGTSGGTTVSVDIPAGTTITGSATWDGTIEAPTATTTTLNLTGFSTSIAAAIEVGSTNSDLTFDKAVKLTFAGQGGKQIGWYNHAGNFTEITSVCTGSNDEATQTTNLAAGSSCKVTVGADLVVWTKHFSTFVAYTSTAQTTTSSSGGGGGNGAPAGTLGTSNAVIPTTGTTGTTGTSNTNTQTQTTPTQTTTQLTQTQTQPTTAPASSGRTSGGSVAVATGGSSGGTSGSSQVIQATTSEPQTVATASSSNATSSLAAAAATSGANIPAWVWWAAGIVVVLGAAGWGIYSILRSTPKA